jgi:AraC-like DNA-binding protein
MDHHVVTSPGKVFRPRPGFVGRTVPDSSLALKACQDAHHVGERLQHPPVGHEREHIILGPTILRRALLKPSSRGRVTLRSARPGKRTIRSELSVDELAEVARLSPRQFSRAFRAETGQSSAKAVENLRVEAARLLMEQGRHSMDVIANETGFAHRERKRRAFLRTFGQPPQSIRRNSRVPA